MSEVAAPLLNISTPASVFLAFPPDTACFSTARAQKNKISKDECPAKVTPEMVAFLNLTSDTDNSNFITAYCNNPPADDSCPFGYCSQPDIAGILVRISTYVTNVCLTLLVFYGEDFEDTFYTTLLQLYSILVTAVLTVMQKGLTKLHAVTALSMVASPVTIYILIYSLRNVFGSRTRLDLLIGKGKIAQKALVMVGMLLWFALVIFTFIPSNLKHFSQPSCESPLVFQNVNVFVFAPIFFIPGAFQVGDAQVVGPSVISLLVVFMTAAAFVIAIFKRRRDITGASLRLKVLSAWRLVKNNYPFIHFMIVIFIPSVYWISTVEIGLIGSNDQAFELSFGQILATFVAVPPVIAVAKMAPHGLHWFMNLTWVRAITSQPKRPWNTESKSALPNAQGGDSNAYGYGVQNGPVSFPVSFPMRHESVEYGPGTFDNPRSSIEKPGMSAV